MSAPTAIASLPEKERVVTHVDGVRAWDIFGPRSYRKYADEATLAAGPEVYLVEALVPGWRLRPHYHSVDQFQLVTNGTGFLGKHRLGPGSLHYAGAYTPYGPVLGDDEGFSYLTIRAKVSNETKFMPESRHLRRKVRPREHFVELDLSQTGSRAVMAPQADGLEAFRTVVNPDAAIPFSAPESCGGQIGIVLSGAVKVQSEAYPVWSCIFAPSGASVDGIAGSSEGAQLLYLRFPKTP